MPGRDAQFFFSSRRRHTRSDRDWSSDVCSSDLPASRRVSSSRPPGSRTGSSKGRAEAAAGFDRAISYPPSGMCSALNRRSFPLLRLPHFLGRLFGFPEPLSELVQFGNLNEEIGRIIGEN